MSKAESVVWTAVALVLAMFLASSCTLSYPRDEVGFWQQHVSMSAWGVTMMTMYGPITIGYLSWNRNIAQPPTPANPPTVP